MMTNNFIPLRTALLITSLSAGLLGAVRAQTPACPFRDNDACDRWRFEQLDEELAGVARAAHAAIDGFAHPDTREEAKNSLTEAHRLWLQMRDADCRAESALMWLRSARTREGYTASCRAQATARRIVELKKRYFLRTDGGERP